MNRLASVSVLALVALTACRPAPTTAPEPAPVSDAPTTASDSAAAPEDDGATWTPVAQEEGISVTSRPSERSPLPVFRGVGVVKAPLLEVLAVVTDAERHHEWIFSCSASGLVAQTSDITGIVYNRTATPWPVPDRDVVLDSRVEVIDEAREIVVRFTATEHPDRPVEDGVVRMTYLVGHYHLWAEGDGATRVEYQVDSDPGGRLPTWLATRGTKDMPLESLKGLRTQMVRMQGQYEARIEEIRRTLQLP